MKLSKSKAFMALSFSTMLLTANVVSADIPTDVINEKWGKPTLVYGGSLTDEQVLSVNSAFGIQNVENVNRQLVTAEDMTHYLGVPSDGAMMLSSVLVQKQDAGKGVQVTIKTPILITAITETQYANAAITAGATDVQIEVASPSKVTGESALTGVYKALTANGVSLDPSRTAVAQQELSLVKDLSEEQSTTNNVNVVAIDLAIAQIKIELSEYKKANGSVADEATIISTVQKVFKEYGLEGILTEEQLQNMVNFAKNYQETSAIDSKEALKQLDSFKGKVSEGFDKLVKSAEDTGLREKLGEFLKSLWDTILGLFN